MLYHPSSSFPGLTLRRQYPTALRDISTEFLAWKTISFEGALYYLEFPASTNIQLKIQLKIVGAYSHWRRLTE
jgi:hypothetical protein